MVPRPALGLEVRSRYSVTDRGNRLYGSDGRRRRRVISVLVQTAIGVGVGVGLYTVGSLLMGTFTWEGLGAHPLKTSPKTSATVFISSAVNAIKYAARYNNLADSGLSSYELDSRSIAEAKQGNPSWSTFRRRVWKNEAKYRPEIYDDQVGRMLKGLAPKVDGKAMHLHHVVGKSNNMYNVIKVTQVQHIAIHKVIGYHYNAMWTLESIISLL